MGHSIAIWRLGNQVSLTPLLHSKFNFECSRRVSKTWFLSLDRVMECPILGIMCIFYVIALWSSFQTFVNVIIPTFPCQLRWDHVQNIMSYTEILILMNTIFDNQQQLIYFKQLYNRIPTKERGTTQRLCLLIMMSTLITMLSMIQVKNLQLSCSGWT